MSDSADIRERLQEVAHRLEQLRGQLDALSRAIWQNIDHDDSTRLEAGVRFKQGYNERRGALEQAMGQMLDLLKDYPTPEPRVSDAQPQGEPEAAGNDSLGQGAEVAAVRESVATSAAGVGDLEQKMPFGFVLGGRNYTSASAWPLFYEALLQELYGQSPEKLSRLADAPEALEQEGRPLFARIPDPLEDPLPIADAIFAEAAIAPDALLEVISRLIGYMGYPLDSFKILLKEKNRGTVETLSLAA